MADLVQCAHPSATMLVPRSKADPEGAMVNVARDNIALVHKWIERNGGEDGHPLHLQVSFRGTRDVTRG